MRKIVCTKCGKVVQDGLKCTCKSVRKEYLKRYNENHKEDLALIKSQKWQKKRRSIIKRDGGVCQRCLIKYNLITVTDLQVHHIKPRNKYPELIFEDDNLICLCGTCNRQLGTRESLDFTPNERQEIEYIL